jgi:hypothetical protein
MDVVPSGKRRWNHKQKASNTLILQHGKRTNLAKNSFGIALITLFRNAFGVLKRGKPSTDYEFLC